MTLPPRGAKRGWQNAGRPRQNSSMTLNSTRERDPDRAARVRRILADVDARLAAEDRPRLSSDSLYDERGLPV
ncbi:hypothetical protein CLV56_3896 [Mumia flava]|uniref:Uncharacterized protein n=1 Tax=Mumia flava TaxID=1348852 RepID=A0A2M9B8W9_9ACTN|nr:hypothetical protein CLV56_3896 [Mumia flava]